MAIAILMGSGGRGISSDELSATAGNVLTGKTYVGADTNDGIGTGIMPDRGAVSAELAAGGSYAVPEGFHNGSGIITAKSLASQTVGNATESHILSGKKAWVNGSQIIGNIASQAGGTFNPTTSVRTLATGGKYLTSDVKVNGFALPPASALKEGYKYTLYGQSVTGTLTKDYDLIKGSKALVPFSNYTNAQGSFVAVSIGAIAHSTAKIDLTNYKYLKLFCAGAQYNNAGDVFYTSNHVYYTFGIGTTASTFTKSASHNGYSVGVLNVSSYTGSYYILIEPTAEHPYSGAFGLVYDCYLTMS